MWLAPGLPNIVPGASLVSGLRWKFEPLGKKREPKCRAGDGGGTLGSFLRALRHSRSGCNSLDDIWPSCSVLWKRGTLTYLWYVGALAVRHDPHEGPTPFMQRLRPGLCDS